MALFAEDCGQLEAIRRTDRRRLPVSLRFVEEVRPADERSEQTFHDTEIVFDRLDENTAGGIQAVIARIDELEQNLTPTKREKP